MPANGFAGIDWKSRSGFIPIDGNYNELHLLGCYTLGETINDASGANNNSAAAAWAAAVVGAM